MRLSKKGIIVDTEAFHKFVDINNEDSKPVHNCIKKGALKLVYGNDEKSLNEIKRDNRMTSILSKLMKTGAAYQIRSKEKKKEIDDKGGFVDGIKLKIKRYPYYRHSFSGTKSPIIIQRQQR